jgi:hypothetical protein
MSTPAINVPITAEDLTGSAFASAAAKAKTFESSITTSSYSMKEARGAAMLLGEEIGLKMNRHLVSAAASCGMLGTALAAAFPVVAIIGFLEYAERIPDALNRAWQSMSGLKALDEQIEESAKLQEQLHKIAEETLKVSEAYEKLGKSAQQVALVERMAAAAQMASAQARLSMLKSALGEQEALSKQTEDHNMSDGYSAPYSIAVPTAAAKSAKVMADAYRAQIAIIEEGMQKLQIEFDASGKKLDASLVKGFDSAQKSAEQLRKTLDEISRAVDKMPISSRTHMGWWENQNAPLQTPGNAFPFPDLQAGTPSMPLYSGSASAMASYKVQTDQTAAIAAAQQVYVETATAAQKYSDTVDVLTTLLDQGRITQGQFAAAVAQAGQQLDVNGKYFRQFGEEVGRNIEQALLFSRGWTDAFKAILADLVKLILQMYVFKSLASSFGGSGGGFLGAFFSGLAGAKAGGGPVVGGSSYLVGERGPEIFTPGSSGNITPNGVGGTTHYYDMRGAVVTDDLVRKAELVSAMKDTRSQSVAMARNMVHEDFSRGRSSL